jgi:glycosyltransferase involved in cell wall biosynthesis
MDTTGRVSVCIPTYNGAAFVAEAIESVLAQDGVDIEVVVVDDGSDDATLEIVRSVPDSRIQVHRNAARRGIPGNWNRCLEVATGEFVSVFHQDDLMLPGNLESKVGMLAGDPGMSFVHSAIELLVEPSAVDEGGYWVDRSDHDFTAEGADYFRKLYLSDNLICAPAVVARRRCLLDLGGFDEDLGFTPDYEMWLRLCVEGRVGFLSRPLIRYRWHGGNASLEFRGKSGPDEVKRARQQAARHYATRTGRREEGEVLLGAAEALARLENQAAALDRSRALLAGELERLRAEMDEVRRGER